MFLAPAISHKALCLAHNGLTMVRHASKDFGSNDEQQGTR